MPSTEREVPKTFLAALNHLGATFILMFSMTLELIVLVVIRIGNRIEGKPTTRSEPPMDETKPHTAPPTRRKTKTPTKPDVLPLDDDEFQRALAIAAALKSHPVEMVKQMAFDLPSILRETPVPPAPAPPSAPSPAARTEPPAVQSPAHPPPISSASATSAAVTPPMPPPLATPTREEVAPATELVDEHIYEGTLTWAGHKSHLGNGKSYVCFTAYLKLTSGDEKMIQATALKDAFKSADVNAGDTVTIKLSREIIGTVNGSKRYRNHCVVIKH